MSETRLLVSEAHRYAQSLDDALRIAHASADPDGLLELYIREVSSAATNLRLRLSALLSALRTQEGEEVRS